MVLLIWHLVNCCTVGTVLGGGDCRVADYWVILMRSQGSDSHQSWEVESVDWPHKAVGLLVMRGAIQVELGL